MVELTETRLPGVGHRIEFIAADGARVGVVHARSGKRELFVCAPTDPDSVSMSLKLTDDESHALADALGGSSIVETLDALTQEVEGLAIDWLPVEVGAAIVGKSIGDGRVRTRTGVSIVAVIRDGRAHPAPGPDFGIETGDVLVVVGTADGIAMALEILTTG
ncbi:MAG: cation:proton antiporter regulatory subunit [Acidimicrobiia bacterium]|nr:cation:proton antiporter regulatory subunit [Acidimicrobiia bacterium]